MDVDRFVLASAEGRRPAIVRGWERERFSLKLSRAHRSGAETVTAVIDRRTAVETAHLFFFFFLAVCGPNGGHATSVTRCYLRRRGGAMRRCVDASMRMLLIAGCSSCCFRSLLVAACCRCDVSLRDFRSIFRFRVLRVCRRAGAGRSVGSSDAMRSLLGQERSVAGETDGHMRSSMPPASMWNVASRCLLRPLAHCSLSLSLCLALSLPARVTVVVACSGGPERRCSRENSLNRLCRGQEPTSVARDSKNRTPRRGAGGHLGGRR